MNTRKTKQKELIINTLKDNTTHPTMAAIVDEVQNKDNSIGIATVYRNVNKLVEEGVLKKITTNDDLDRYDSNINPHLHIKCNKCGLVKDLFDDNYLAVIKMIEDKHSVKINESNLFLEGVCKECLEN